MTHPESSSLQHANRLISIIVPCYNVERYLPRCLNSLINQTLGNIEVICINDGSTDHTLDILRDYERRYPNVLRLINKKNAGAWAARRDGILSADGEYIGFLDGDDYAEPNFCELLYETARANDSDITLCGYYRVDNDSGIILAEELTDQRQSFRPRQHPERLLQINGAPWNKLYASNLLKDLYSLSTSPEIFEDIMMLLLIYPKAKSVSFVSEPLVRYYIHGGSMMSSISKSQIQSTYDAFAEIRDYYVSTKQPKSMMSFLDSAAFLHLGISLMFRISYDKTASLGDVLKENRAFLDSNFPTWRTSRDISFHNARLLGGPFRNMYLGRLAYKLHLMPLALRAYRFMIDRLGIDVKW